MSLHFSLPDRCMYIHNIDNLVNLEKVSINISIFKHKLAIYPNKKYIILRDFNPYHEVWGESRAFRVLIEKSEELLMVT